MTKHIHAELIKKWADGAEIQLFEEQAGHPYWVTVTDPQWSKDKLYRVKAKPFVISGSDIFMIKYESYFNCCGIDDGDYIDLTLRINTNKRSDADVFDFIFDPDTKVLNTVLVRKPV